MRQIGQVPQQAAAERFTAYLITQGIAAQAEHQGETWAVWVRNEDQVTPAREAFRQFAEHPDDPRYDRVVHEASLLLQQEAARQTQARRNIVEVRARWSRTGKRKNPLTNVILGLCAAVFVLTGFGADRTSSAQRMLGFRNTARLAGQDGDQLSDRLVDIERGQVWRLVTPIFLHHDILHLIFNLLMFQVFASRIEDRLGTVRLAWMVLVIALVSNTAQGLAPSSWGAFGGSPFFLGISGVVYGLFGYVWMKTMYEPELGLFVSGTTVALLLAWMFLGLFGLLDGAVPHAANEPAAHVGIANLAHVVGLFTGLVLGGGLTVWRRLTAGL